MYETRQRELAREKWERDRGSGGQRDQGGPAGQPECSPMALEWTTRGMSHKYISGYSTESRWDETRQETRRQVGSLL